MTTASRETGTAPTALTGQRAAGTALTGKRAAGTAAAGEPAAGGDVTPAGMFRCECGHLLCVFGRDRHRIFFPPDNDRLDDPVMDGLCPTCGRRLLSLGSRR